MEFLIIGETERSKNDLKQEIQRMGGRVGRKIHDKLAAIISNEDEVKNMSYKMEDAKKFGIQVVSEDFVDSVHNEDAISYIKNKSICDWGTDVCFS